MKENLKKRFLHFLIIQEMKLSGSNIKKFLIFCQKKSFFIIREKETKNEKKPALKKCLTFREMKLTSPKNKQKTALKNFFVPCDFFVIFTAVKASGNSFRKFFQQIPCEEKIQHRDITL